MRTYSLLSVIVLSSVATLYFGSLFLTYDSVRGQSLPKIEDTKAGEPPCDFPALETGTEYGVDSQPYELAVGDLNDDGRKDIVSANYSGQTISVLIADSAGGFLPATSISNSCLNRHVRLGDLDNDSDLDAVIVSSCQPNGYKIFVYLGNGTGALNLHSEYAFADAASVELADLDHDNKLDIFALSWTALRIYRGDGTGGFAVLSENLFPAYGATPKFDVFDFDQDGEMDVALGAGDKVRLWKGNGLGTFVEVWSAFPLESVYSGDFNGDGNRDIVAMNDGLSRMRVYLGNGLGNFSLRDTYDTNGGSQDRAFVADVNGDGIEDIVVSNHSVNGVSVFLASGSGTFLPKLDFNTSVGSGDIVVTDMTGDNIPDLVIAETYSYPNNLVGKVIITKGIGDGRFRAPIYVQTLRYGSPSSLVMTDLNEDRRDDIVIGNGQLFGLSVLIRTGDLTFDTRRDLLQDKEVTGVTAGDVNSDGHTDIVAVGARQVYVVLGDGQGGLTLTNTMQLASGDWHLMHVNISDYNNDGIPDLVVGGRLGSNFFFYRGSGGGGFLEPVVYTGSQDPIWEITSEDFNADGRIDLAVLFGAGVTLGSRVEIWLNNGIGFSYRGSVNLGNFVNAHSMASGDFNNDGIQDLTVGIGYNAGTLANMRVLQGAGNGDFAMGARVEIPDNYPIDVVVKDINSDGNLDLSVVNHVNQNVVVLKGNGAGSFQIVQWIAAANYAWRIGVGNLTPDTSPDFVVTNYLSNSITIIPNNCNRVYGTTPTPTSSPTATPTATPAWFEGDVAPRPNGDGGVVSADVVQVRRFVSGLDTPGLSPNEFQRTDSAPRATLGDGVINSSDVVQARRYGSGLDALTNAGGPTVAADSGLRAVIGGSLLGAKVEGQGLLRLASGDSGAVVVELLSGSEVAAVSFRLSYDAALGKPLVSLGDVPDGAVLTVNDRVAGELTVLIDSAGPIGARGKALRLVEIGFEAKAVGSVELIGVPSASDLFGNGVLR